MDNEKQINQSINQQRNKKVVIYEKKSINDILLKIKIMKMIIMIIIITIKMIKNEGNNEEKVRDRQRAIMYYYSTETS